MNRSINLVVSDHSPCEVSLKKLCDGDFMKAWGGISSLQFGKSSSYFANNWLKDQVFLGIGPA